MGRVTIYVNGSNKTYHVNASSRMFIKKNNKKHSNFSTASIPEEILEQFKKDFESKSYKEVSAEEFARSLTECDRKE